VALLLGLVASLGVGPYVAPRECCCKAKARQTASAELPPCCANRVPRVGPAASCCQHPAGATKVCCGGGGAAPCKCVGCPSDTPVEPLMPGSVDTSSPTVQFATFCPTPLVPVAVRLDSPSRLAAWRAARGDFAEPLVRELFCVWVI
jgi:hypothetical protein